MLSIQAVQRGLPHDVHWRWFPSEELKLLGCLPHKHLQASNGYAPLCLRLLFQNHTRHTLHDGLLDRITVYTILTGILDMTERP